MQRVWSNPGHILTHTAGRSWARDAWPHKVKDLDLVVLGFGVRWPRHMSLHWRFAQEDSRLHSSGKFQRSYRWYNFHLWGSKLRNFHSLQCKPFLLGTTEAHTAGKTRIALRSIDSRWSRHRRSRVDWCFGSWEEQWGTCRWHSIVLKSSWRFDCIFQCSPSSSQKYRHRNLQSEGWRSGNWRLHQRRIRILRLIVICSLQEARLFERMRRFWQCNLSTCKWCSFRWLGRIARTKEKHPRRWRCTEKELGQLGIRFANRHHCVHSKQARIAGKCLVRYRISRKLQGWEDR